MKDCPVETWRIGSRRTTILRKQNEAVQQSVAEEDWRESRMHSRNHWWTGEARFEVHRVEKENAKRKCSNEFEEHEFQRNIEFLEEGANDERMPGSSTDSNSDHWEKKGLQWIRHHAVPTTLLFIPDGTGGPAREKLTDVRITSYTPLDHCGSSEYERRDAWNEGIPDKDEFDISSIGVAKWTGRTVFEEIQK